MYGPCAMRTMRSNPQKPTLASHQLWQRHYATIIHAPSRWPLLPFVIHRTYTSYACVPSGFSMLYLYDSYGDGWPGGGLITVSYLRSAASSYRLANATVRGYNSSLALNIFANMPNTAGELENLSTKECQSAGVWWRAYVGRLLSANTFVQGFAGRVMGLCRR